MGKKYIFVLGSLLGVILQEGSFLHGGMDMALA